ncbi:MAG: sporulation initiation factor Spo0A C-terminal domain-containing protein, partial [bacterium]|nr:sporulation initiation factor Spo0A C-terminal domain-containing protein [bacterium]
IINLLLNYGFAPSLKGFKYLVEAIDYVIKFDDNRTEKVIYPTLARKFYTSNYGIERTIRYSIEITLKDFWLKTGIKPTNKNVITYLALQLK